MAGSIFLPRPSRFDEYFSQAKEEYLNSRIDGDNLVTPDLISQIKPDLTFGELIQAIQPDKEKSVVSGNEIILINKNGKILYRKLFEQKLF